MLSGNVVLITGASSGLGKVTASLLSERGYSVFGTSRADINGAEYPYPMVQLDVHSEESAGNCVQTVMKQAGRLDVLINNAGYMLTGAIEETSLEEAQLQFETNFFGVARMVRQVLPIMRLQKRGHIINIGSLAGLIGVPFHGFYSASKYALEGYSESLRQELKDFNIDVSIIEPSFMHTNLEKNGHVSTNLIHAYERLRSRAFRFFQRSVDSGFDPLTTVRIILSAIESESPRLRYRAGKKAKWIPRMKSILPMTQFEAGFRRHMKLDT